MGRSLPIFDGVIEKPAGQPASFESNKSNQESTDQAWFHQLTSSGLAIGFAKSRVSGDRYALVSAGRSELSAALDQTLGAAGFDGVDPAAAGFVMMRVVNYSAYLLVSRIQERVWPIRVPSEYPVSSGMPLADCIELLGGLPAAIGVRRGLLS